MVWLLNVKLGAEQSTYLAKLEIENWSAAYRAHCRSTPCALPAAYHARTRVRIIPRAPRSTQRALRSLSCASLAVHRAHLRRYPALAHIALRNLRTVKCAYRHLNHKIS